MSDKPETRIEIEKAVAKKTTNAKLLKKVEEELDILEVTDGLGGKTNIESLYSIWKSGQRGGEKNDINSWTAYALGLTKVKPDGDFLPKRRAFARAGFPDIDTDFDDERRDDVYNYLIDKYGRKQVGNIGAHQTFKMKAAVKAAVKSLDAARAFHKGPDECRHANAELANEISKSLPVLNTGIIRWNDEDGNEIKIKTLAKAAQYVPDFRDYMKDYPDVLRHAKNLEGLSSTFTQHPAGVVIADTPINQIAPLRENKKGYATQFTMEEVEVIGLIKFDILALATLTIIREATELVKTNYGIDIDIENLPLEDKKTLDLYRSGKLDGVFQCESYGMQSTMREIGVDKFDDVMAAIALYRPGPMDSIPDYVMKKRGEKRVDYFHKSLEPFVKKYLERSYGVLVYQEQLMQLCSSLANFTITDGYIMIKAVSKKKLHLMDKFKKQFISGGKDNGIEESILEQYWTSKIIPFADYGFNAAHSCCYAYLSFQTAYLKSNYPDEFAIASINANTRRAVLKSASAWPKVAIMERDARRVLGIKILPRNLNDCDVMAAIEKKKDRSKGVLQSELRPGLCCKGLGYAAALHIAENRPYTGVDDLAVKTDSSKVSIKAVEALIEGGYFKGKSGIKNRDKILDRFSKVRDGLKASKNKGVTSMDLFA